MNEDGTTMTGTTEAVVLDRDGKVMGTFPGATNAAMRISAHRETQGELARWTESPVKEQE